MWATPDGPCSDSQVTDERKSKLTIFLGLTPPPHVAHRSSLASSESPESEVDVFFHPAVPAREEHPFRMTGARAAGSHPLRSDRQQIASAGVR